MPQITWDYVALAKEEMPLNWVFQQDYDRKHMSDTLVPNQKDWGNWVASSIPWPQTHCKCGETLKCSFYSKIHKNLYDGLFILGCL